MSTALESLTSKQKKVYYAIEDFLKNKGIPPTIREIGEMVGEKTPSGVQGVLNRLQQKGIIKRESGMSRSIQILSNDTQYATPFHIPELKRVNAKNLDDLFSVYNIAGKMPLPPGIWDLDESCFMIDCPDASLKESTKIEYGDKLIINTKRKPVDADIVMIEYNGHILLRKYFRDAGMNNVRLTADSDVHGKEVFGNGEFRVVGVLVGTVKMY
jgi:repressor LexA